MSEKKRNTENYKNDKYCLMNFVGILNDKSLMNESEGKELLDIVFGGEKYRFPYCYDGSGDQFCLCTERSKYNNFCDLAARMVYTKKTSEGTNRRRTCLFNGNSHAAMTGRLITQYYIDGFKTYEVFFNELLSSKEICDTDAILNELYKSSGYKMDGELGTAKKLVAYLICSFHPDNLTTFDEDVQDYVSEKSSFKPQERGVYDIFWQVENSKHEKMSSRFVHDFADSPKGDEMWVLNYWPISEYISARGEYVVKNEGGEKEINRVHIQTIPQWVMPKNLLPRLLQLYLSPDSDDELMSLRQVLFVDDISEEDLSTAVEQYLKLSPEDRNRSEDIAYQIIKLLWKKSDKLDKDHTTEKKSADNKPNKGDNNLTYRLR